jgi:group I intron endonuclease
MNYKIYVIINLINDKKYVGSTTQTLKNRLKQHENKSAQVSNNKFHNAIRKYGIENFVISELESGKTEENIIDIEEKWIRKLNTVDKGYNCKYRTEDYRYNTLTNVSKEELYDLYITKNLSTIAIGEIYGVVNTTVGNRLRYYGIPTRKGRQGRAPNKYNLNLTKEYLYEEFIIKDRLMKDIAVEHNVPTHTIQTSLTKYNIKKRNKDIVCSIQKCIEGSE